MNSLFLGLLLFCGSMAASAARLESVNTRKEDGIYFVDLSIQADVPALYAHSVLADPVQFMAINPSIYKVEYLPRRADEYRRFRSSARSCALFYCISYRNVAQMWLRENQDIELIVEPGASDFEYGKIVWHIEALGKDSSRLSFHAENKPSFWIPPLLGTAILQTQLASDIAATMRNMECNYRGSVPCTITVDQYPEEAEDEF